MCLHRLHWLLKVILDWLFDFFAMNLYFDINSGSIARSNLNCVQTKYLLAAFVFYAHVHLPSFIFCIFRESSSINQIVLAKLLHLGGKTLT